MNGIAKAIAGIAMIAGTGFLIILIYTILTLARPVVQDSITACTAAVRNDCL